MGEKLQERNVLSLRDRVPQDHSRKATTSGRTGGSFLVNSSGISQLGAISPFFFIF